MIVDIDNEAKNKIKMWDKDVSNTFSLIFDIISYDFFARGKGINITNSKGNQVKVSDIDNADTCYISYNAVSDIFNSEIIISNDDKSFGYEINKSEHGINLNLREIRKRIDNYNILDICMLGYGIVVRLCNCGKIDALEFRGNDLSIDYYKLMSSKLEYIKDFNYITECVVGEVNEITKNQYGKKNNYYIEKNKKNSSYIKIFRKE